MPQEGRLWLLHPPESSGGDGSGGGELDGALLVFHKSHNHNSHENWLAGVVAGSERALAAAVHKAVQLEPQCTEFYVDRCGRFDAPHFLRGAAGRPGGGYACDHGPSHFLVMAKRLGGA